MSQLKNLKPTPSTIKRPWELRVLFWAGICAIGAAIVITAAYYFDVATESRAFCGLLCHPNEPQYYAQEVSVHADLECGTCHVGPGLWPKIEAKILGTRELYSLVTNSYERPIAHPVNQLRPADEICEQCHSPDMPYEDQMERISHFASDEANTQEQTLLMVKIDDQGEGDTGAHWHIDNPVWFVSPDEVDAQEIPWVSRQDENGQVVVYRDRSSTLSDSELSSLSRQEMDCLDCHNRANHEFENPESRLDQALASGDMDSELPYVKREGVKLLLAGYSTQEAAMAAMDGLADFYRTEYPDVYTAKTEEIGQATEVLREIYGQTTFPRMNVTWTSYPNNLGHTDFPGCFRCHDGSHVTDTGQAIPYECSTCHTIPVVLSSGQTPEPAQFASWAMGTERPASHAEPNFYLDHRILADQSCADCHGTVEYGTDDSGFCANGICHEQKLPGVALEPAAPHPVLLVGEHAQVACIDCHQGVREPADLDDCASCHQPPTPHLGTACADCHEPFGWKESAAAWKAVVSFAPHQVQASMDCLSCHTGDAATAPPENHREFPGELCLSCHTAKPVGDTPAIPHTLDGASNCLVCHDEGKLKPVPADHRGWPSEFCTLCHAEG